MNSRYSITRDNTTINQLKAKHKIKTDKALANAMGITPSNLSNKLRGTISSKTIEELAFFFQVDSVKDMFR